jgi:hypothetical protein
MTDPVFAAARQAMSAPEAKNREQMGQTGPPPESKEWMHVCSFTFHNLISPLDPPDAKMLELVRKKDNETVLRLAKRNLSACFGVCGGLSLSRFEEVVCNDSVHQIRVDPSALPDAKHSPSNECSKQHML